MTVRSWHLLPIIPSISFLVNVRTSQSARQGLIALARKNAGERLFPEMKYPNQIPVAAEARGVDRAKSLHERRKVSAAWLLWKLSSLSILQPRGATIMLAQLKANWPILCAIVFFFALIAAIGPWSELPINDDWQYAHFAKPFAERGHPA